MRAYIFDLLTTDSGLADLGLPAGNVFPVNMVDTPANPFIVLNFSDNQSAEYASRNLPSQPQLLDVWCYDSMGDYARIDNMLARTKYLFDQVVGVKTDVGYITQIDWVGNGGDNYDDVYKAIVRTGSYRIIASRSGNPLGY
jgi:hypothetical protein